MRGEGWKWTGRTLTREDPELSNSKPNGDTPEILFTWAKSGKKKGGVSAKGRGEEVAINKGGAISSGSGQTELISHKKHVWEGARPSVKVGKPLPSC